MAENALGYKINPAMDRWPAESALIGKIILAFGELEFMFCNMAADAIDRRDQVLRALYRITMTRSRIEAADGLMRAEFEKDHLNDAYTEAYGMVKHCLSIRNQYAHCNWGDHVTGGLFFTSVQDGADAHEGFSYAWRHTDLALLQSQHDYFAYAMEWLRYLEQGMKFRRGKQTFYWPVPQEPSKPPLHNPPEAHVPPWLNKAEKALHVARAMAASGGPETPTPARQALEAARQRKRAEREAHRKKSNEGRQKNGGASGKKK